MTKRERIEDLGVLASKLDQIIQDLETPYGHYLHSKHSFDEFYAHIRDEESADDLHRFLRWHHENLCEALAIACGDDGDCGNEEM